MHKSIHAGGEKNENCVGLILDNDKEMCSGKFISDITHLVKLKQKPIYIANIVVYASTVQSMKEEIDNSYDSQENVNAQCKLQKSLSSDET